MEIDRLTLVADWAKQVVEKNTSGEYVQLDKILAPLSAISRRTFARWPYRYQFTTDDGFTLQIADQKAPVPPVRIDYNPQSCPSAEGILSRFKHALSSVRVSRLDYAHDYSQDLSQVNFNQTDPVKTCTFRARSGRLETAYLGATSSPLRFRIYDKAKESGSGGVKWRIESQMRFKPKEDFRTAEPFALLVISEPDYAGRKIQERAMIAYLIANPAGFDELGSDSRAKYKAIINEQSKTSLVTHPHTIYTKEKNRLVAEVEAIINDLTTLTQQEVMDIFDPPQLLELPSKPVDYDVSLDAFLAQIERKTQKINN